MERRIKEQIDENRRRALERLQMRQINKVQQRSVPLPEEQRIFIQNPQNHKLTTEQKAKIERNKIEAIEKAKAKQTSPIGKSIPPSKSAVVNSRPFPYPLSAKNSSTINKTDVPSTSKPLVQSKIGKHVTCDLEFITEDRFVVKTDNYSDALISVFKDTKSKSYNAKDRTWTFALSDYEDLLRRITVLQRDSNITVRKIPEFVIKQMRKPIPNYADSILDQNIDSKLLESLFPFQREGVMYGISRGGRFLLGDDMGLGKTRQALAVAAYYRDEWPLLIVTTAATRDMWSDQVFDLLPSVNCSQVVVIRSSKEVVSGARIVICSYSSLEGSKKKLELMNFGVVILDESHSIKDSRAKQTINATKLGVKAKRAILITGTPAMSRPSELYSQLAIIDKKFVDYIKFTLRYCDGKSTQFGWEANGAEHLDELNILLSKSFMIRRTKENVCFELGDKRREVVRMEDFKLSMKDAKNMNEFSNQYQNVQGKKQAENDILLSWYASTAKLKAPAVCQYLKETLPKCDEKFLIFAHHHILMDEISSTLASNKIKFIRIDGSTRSDIRNSLVESFQNNPDIKCAILSIRACSAGITLTAASKIIFAELDWTPSTILQAEGRAHRIGQEKQVHTTFLIAPNTADEIIWKKLQWKQKNLDKIGLVAKNEHLSDHEVKITMCEPSTSSKPNQITNYFEKKDSSMFSTNGNDSITTEDFFSCNETLFEAKNLADYDENSENISQETEIDWAEIDKIEKQVLSPPVDKKIVDELLDGIDLDDDF